MRKSPGFVSRRSLQHRDVCIWQRRRLRLKGKMAGVANWRSTDTKFRTRIRIGLPIAWSDFGYLTRFAVFEFPRNSSEIRRRAELERTICHFAENYSKHESVDQLMEAMVGEGFDPDLVHETESVSTIAFGRAFFEQHGVQYSSTVIRALRDGRIQADVPLMGIPAYSRARAIAVRLRETMNPDEFQALCLYNAESNAILKAMEAAGAKWTCRR